MSPRTEKLTITITKDYDLFHLIDKNRRIDIKKHKGLYRSLQKNGYYNFYPIICLRGGGKLYIQDGQHRLAIARELKIPVSYLVTKFEIDIPAVNAVPVKWSYLDYVEAWISAGKGEYQKGLDFYNRHSMSITKAFTLLSGRVNFAGFKDTFISGGFKIKSYEMAERVAGMHDVFYSLSKHMQGQRFVEALQAVAMVKGFEPNRLMQNVVKCREKIIPYSTRDAFLDMLQDIYNFRKRALFPLKIQAIQAGKARNPACSNKA